MGRPRNFDEDDVVRRAADAFGRFGYAACSVDDLVEATGLQRGSLYKVFGSKRGLFEQVLQQALAGDWQNRPASLDLMITALRELAADDPPIADLCRRALTAYGERAPELLGARLLAHLPHKD
jgi:TetR/AcrR family transcriptional regulator, transcriptional repressor for nem operon